MSESNIMKECLLALSQIPCVRLFRNNVAMAWVGKAKRFTTSQNVRVDAGDVLIRQARPLHAGLHVGSSDLIGWRTVTITPDMVGRKVAVFLSSEIKANDGRLSAEQRHWLKVVNESGGIGFVAQSAEEAKKLLHEAQ